MRADSNRANKKKPSLFNVNIEDERLLTPQPKSFSFNKLGFLPPQIYLPCLLCLVLILGLFLLLFYPGLWQSQAWLQVDTQPQEANLYVDNVLYGSTPLRLKLSSGSHNLRFEKSFFIKQSLEVKVPKRIIGQLFSLPKREIIQKLSLQTDNSYNLLRFYWQDYIYRSLEAEQLPTFGRSYALPPLLQQAMRSIFYQQNKTAIPSPEQTKKLLVALLENTSSRQQLADLLTATLIAGHPGQLPNLQQLSLLAQDLKSLYAKADQRVAKAWQQTVLPTSWQQIVQQWLSDSEVVAQQAITATQKRLAPASTERLELFGTVFLLVKPLQQPAFYIQQSEVSNRQFARFIAANPKWALQRSDSWQQQFPHEYGQQQAAAAPWLQYREQLTSLDYLSNWEHNSPPKALLDYPLANIDFAAAAAFSNWLTKQLPDKFSHWRVTLPTVKQWQQSYQLLKRQAVANTNRNLSFPPAINLRKLGRLELAGMEDSLLEWSRSSYKSYPLWQENSSLEPLLMWLNPPLRQLQSSSWLGETAMAGKEVWLLQQNIDLPELNKLSSGGAFPATLTSPFLGFRLVLESDFIQTES